MNDKELIKSLISLSPTKFINVMRMENNVWIIEQSMFI